MRNIFCSGSPSGAGSGYVAGDTFDGVTLVVGKTEARKYKAGDTFDNITLATGTTEAKSYKAGDTFDGVTLTAGKTEEKKYVSRGQLRQHYSRSWNYRSQKLQSWRYV